MRHFSISSLRAATPFLLLTMLILSSADAQKKGLIAYWTFDEGRGNTAADISGNGHNGTVKDASWVRGKTGHALSFEAGGYVEIPDQAGLRLKNDLTIAAWIKKTKPSEKGRSMGLVSKSAENVWDYDLFMSTSRLEHPAFYSDAFKAPAGDIEVISSSPISLNEWHHIAITRKGAEAKIFIDGIITGRASLPEDLTSGPRNLFIGYDHDGGFGGVIDEVRLYDRALPDEDVLRLVNHPDTDLSFRHLVIDSAYGGIRAIADVNGDRYQDFIHCYWYDGAPLSWYEYRNAETWDKHVIRKNFYPVTDNFDVADMDQDGDPDIIMAKSDAKRSNDRNADNVVIDKVDIVWFENPRPVGDPRKALWGEHVIGSHVDSNENYIKDIKATDFTGDGRPEVVVRSNVALSIFYLNSGLEWKPLLYRSVKPHEGMDTGDIDCDGDPDVVLNGFWFECPADPINEVWTEHIIDTKWFAQQGDWTANNCKVYVRDINADGCADVLLAHSERAGYPVCWYELDKSRESNWKQHVIGMVDFCHTLQVADMDLDGDMDVVTGEMEKSDDPDQILIFINDGQGTDWVKQVTIPSSIYSGKVGDFDNDGDADLLGNRNFNKAPIEWWQNTTSGGKR